MTKQNHFWRGFSKGDRILWVASVATVILSFCLFDRTHYLTLIASLVGVTSLIFNAKGHPFGQILMILFSLLYGVISYSFAYYGEMITYLGMTAPMAAFSLVSWLKNPFKGNRAEVAVNRLSIREVFFMMGLAVVVTGVFFFILKAFHTAHIYPSTLSVTTSFLAVYLTFRRSEFFALAYAANDVILIILWVIAALEETMYVSVVVCFAAFLINDLYGYICWRRMHRRQRTEGEPTEEHCT